MYLNYIFYYLIDFTQINFVAERFDGVKFPLPHNPMKFCKFLFEERYNKSAPYIQQFHISRAFNFEDQICPILPVNSKSNLIIPIIQIFL